MSSNTKLLTIKMSPAQFKALRELEQVTGKSKSELVRRANGVICHTCDIDFPQDVAKRGKYER